MNRVVLAGYYPPPFAGEPIHVRQLAHFLRTRGVEVEVLNLRRGAPPSPEYRPAGGLSGRVGLLVRPFRPSALFHLHTNGHNWKSWMLVLVGGLAARRRGTPGILTIHSGLMPGYVRRLGRVRAALARWALKSFARIVCVNEDIASALKGLGVGEDRLRVIPAFLGVAGPLALPASDELAIRRFQPLLVVVGGGDEDPELGLPVVAHALRELRETIPRAGAVFVGWMVGSKIVPLLRDLGLEDHSLCLGEVSHERCLALLGRADVVVRSTYTDGDAITVREALALGVPVVASDTSFRPDGTILFRKGESADLLGRLVEVLTRGTRGPRPGPPAESAGAERLWQVYCEISEIGAAGFEPASALAASRRRP